jgi:hypothetical protein
MKDLIKKTLDRCGYEYDGEPTEKLLEECFLDFVADGYFGNLTVEEAIEEIESGDITLKNMCYNLLKR